MNRYTRLALQRANALHTDCRRDQRLAQAWGFKPSHPSVVLPGGGGVRMDVFHPEPPAQRASPVVINPRGWRAYVRNDTFFRAIPLVLERLPDARFLCSSMATEAHALRWLDELGISGSVELLPQKNHAEMAGLFQQATIAVSPSTHDGTPNTLLEAMACGCFPIVGDIESLREWITPGVNGLMINPADPECLAEAILSAWDQPGLRGRAREYNLRLISARAEHREVMALAENFYRSLITARVQA